MAAVSIGLDWVKDEYKLYSLKKNETTGLFFPSNGLFFFFSPGFYQVVLFFMQTETIKKVNFAVKDNRKSHSIITFKNNCKKK